MSTAMSTATGSLSLKSGVQRATFSIDHYEHLIACGGFSGEYEQHVELLWGEIVERAPIGPPHCEDVSLLAEWSYESTAGKPIRVSIHRAIRLPGSDSEPEPDIVWVKEKRYRDRHPNPDEVFLVIEVAESSLEVDRGAKLAAYAGAAIPEYWIVSLPERVVEVCRDPQGNDYADRQKHAIGTRVAPLAVPEAELEVGQLFGNQD